MFTGGIGEHEAFVRERVCRGAAAAWVIPTNGELMIARHTRDLLRGNPG